MTTPSSTAGTVLFIGGSGRSGSTLLDRLLGRLPGFVAVGETRYLWREALTGLKPCGCGEPFRSCPFWSDVGRVAFGGWDRVDVAGTARLEASVARQRDLVLLRHPELSPSFAHRLAGFTDVLSRLYRGIVDVSGCPVVVDSTKDPAYGSVLTRLDGMSVAMVHLVRDSRGVAYSWNKPIVEEEPARADRLMRRFPPATSAVRWVLYNALIDGLAKRVPTSLVRYEDLVRAPWPSLRSVSELVGGRPIDVGALENGRVASLGADHTMVGNPMRMARGPVALTVDDEWMRSMRRLDRAIVTGITWPMLRRYGYRPPPTGSPRGEPVVRHG